MYRQTRRCGWHKERVVSNAEDHIDVVRRVENNPARRRHVQPAHFVADVRADDARPDAAGIHGDRVRAALTIEVQLASDKLHAPDRRAMQPVRRRANGDCIRARAAEDRHFRKVVRSIHGEHVVPGAELDVHILHRARRHAREQVPLRVINRAGETRCRHRVVRTKFRVVDGDLLVRAHAHARHV